MNKLKARREALNLTQKQVAERIGIKEIINVELLEEVYRKRIHEVNGKTCIPIEVMEKAVVLEIYKMLSVIFEKRENKGGNGQKKSK